MEPSSWIDTRDSSPEHRETETLALATKRATHVEMMERRRPNDVPVKTFQVGDFVLVARGRALGPNIKWPAFTSKFYGPCMVISAHHPRYSLVSGHNRHTRQDIHARRLVKYNPRLFVEVAPE